MSQITKSGTQGVAIDTVAAALKINLMNVEKAYCWLLKYGYISRV